MTLPRDRRRRQVTLPRDRRWLGPVLLGVTATVFAAAAPASALGPPALSVTAATLVAPSTGQQLDGVAPNAEVPIASTTKLMTALITLEHVRHLGQVFTMPDWYASSADSQIGLRPGDRMTVHDLLLALMLPSADDAAEDLGYNVGDRSVARFIGMMNARARQLGLTHTHYSTPIGLDTPGNYSSASDLVKLADYLLTHSRFFARIVAEPSATLDTGPQHHVVNRNDLVARFKWINGVKTGHTNGAGYVLVASATRGGLTLLSAVLGTSSIAARDANTMALLNWGYGNFRLVTPVKAGEVMARLPVADRPGFRAAVIAESSFTRVVDIGARVSLKVATPHQLTGPLKRHAVVGYMFVRAGRRTLARIRLLLANKLAAVSPLTIAARFITRPITLLLALVLVGLLILILIRRRGRGRAQADPE
ncbi:MAG TPA: D-alanyl-D-alanine carboxypeptidase family protein [Solirubrobacteraceae bacterium]|nr:D-alanyl-D-alanine carboxypeptidase family protein [Solirubrobacteraceae bacterium]